MNVIITYRSCKRNQYYIIYKAHRSLATINDKLSIGIQDGDTSPKGCRNTHLYMDFNSSLALKNVFRISHRNPTQLPLLQSQVLSLIPDFLVLQILNLM